MPEKPPTHSTITVFIETKQAIKEIRKLPHMLDEDGMQRSTPIVMAEVVESYLKAHQKGQQ